MLSTWLTVWVPGRNDRQPFLSVAFLRAIQRVSCLSRFWWGQYGASWCQGVLAPAWGSLKSA